MRTFSFFLIAVAFLSLPIQSIRADEITQTFLPEVAAVQSWMRSSTWIRHKVFKSISEEESAALEGKGFRELILHVAFDPELIALAMKEVFMMSSCTVLNMTEEVDAENPKWNRFSIEVILSGDALRQLRAPLPRWLRSIEPKWVQFQL